MAAPPRARHRRAAGSSLAPRQRLWLALALVLAFMIAEVVAALTARSLALLSDAAHMLTDAAALGLALVAIRLAETPPRRGYTYGLKRAEILSALVNGTALGVLALGIAGEAVRRLVAPPPTTGAVVLLVALVGVAVNLVAATVLRGDPHRSLNVEAGLRHVLTDLYAFAATAAAGLVMVVTGFTRADALASLAVASLMVVTATRLVRAAGRSLLEAAPRGIDVGEVGTLLAAHPHVASLHDLHVWEITSGFPALSAHVLVHEGDDCHALRQDLERLLADRFGIDHTTLQVDHASPSTVHWLRRVPASRPRVPR
ncbi:MAG: cation diffusion facilitator family transporter [Candidatus Dormibacteria bacterium]